MGQPMHGHVQRRENVVVKFGDYLTGALSLVTVHNHCFVVRMSDVVPLFIHARK